MKVQGIDHITINVTDLNASEQFYREIMGFEKSGFIDMGDHTLTYFKLTPSVRLELIAYINDTGRATVKEATTGIYRHFCLETDDIESAFRDCKNGGAVIRKEPSYVEKLHCRTMLIVDPNGVEIEIIEK